MTRRNYHTTASIVLLGFHGAGKQTLGLIASLALRRRCINFESLFERSTGYARHEYISSHGSTEYAKVEYDVSKELLERYSQNHVIIGFGELRSAKQQNLLQHFSRNHPVIYIRRARSEILEYMVCNENNKSRLFQVRHRDYELCSNFDFWNLTQRVGMECDESNSYSTLRLKQTESDFVVFLDRVFDVFITPLLSSDPFSPSYTYSLQVACSQVEEAQVDCKDYESGADTLTLIVELAQAHNDAFSDYLSRLISTLRRCARIPIILKPGQTIPIGSSAYTTLLELGIRNAVDYITVDLGMERDKLVPFTIASHTKVLGRYSIVTKVEESSQHAFKRINDAAKDLCCYAIRVELDTSSKPDPFRSLRILHEAKGYINVPLTVVTSDCFERTAICFNPVLSPVNLSSEPNGMTVKQAQTVLYTSFVLRRKNFTIVGKSVEYSLSPVMHNAAYEACGMPHRYDVLQIDSFEDNFSRLLQDPECGGVVVSLPFKTNVLSLVDEISDEAKSIGAVNTVLVSSSNNNNADRRIKGFNTDYIGIKQCIYSHLSPANAVRDKTTALIIGAGGMARAAIFACHKLTIKNVYVYNRTLQHAVQLAEYYNSWSSSSGNHEPNMKVDVLPSLSTSWPEEKLQPTIIVSCIPAHSIDGNPPAEFSIPCQWLRSRTGGTFIDLAYKPLRTNFIRQIEALTSEGWIVVNGLSVLVQQGIAQFEILTGRPAPIHVMERAVKDASLNME